jgi:hypothetical protein
MTTCVLAGSKIDGKTKIQYDSGLAGTPSIETHCMGLAVKMLVHQSDDFSLVSAQYGVDCLNVVYHCAIDNRDYHVTIKAVD